MHVNACQASNIAEKDFGDARAAEFTIGARRGLGVFRYVGG
jgi:hypothetical protein